LVTLGKVTVFATGVLFSLEAVAADEELISKLFSPDAADDGIGEMLEPSEADFLRFRILFADGRTVDDDCEALDGVRRLQPVAASEPILWCYVATGGEVPGMPGTTGRYYEAKWWLRPLPPAGPLTVCCQWEAADIHDQATTLDGEVIQQAASAARRE